MIIPSCFILKIFLIFLFFSEGTRTQAGDLAAKSVAEPEKKYSFDYSVGYDTEYVFRGFSYADDLAWVQTIFNYTIDETYSFWVGGLAAANSTGEYTEFDAIGEFGVTHKSWYIGIGLNNYSYPATGDGDEFGMGLNLQKSLGKSPFSLINQFYYVPNLQSMVWTGGARAEGQISDRIGFEASADITYNHHYWIDDSGWNNVDCRLTLPISATPKITISPYLALSIPMAALTALDTPVYGYGGISATRSF
jgi:Bacterial protein of unknown function (Gcw_chp)